MTAQSEYHWAIFALVAAMYVVMCLRIARRMARIGRSGVAWFFISFFCTAGPAAIAIRRHCSDAEPPDQDDDRARGRCVHCGAVLGRTADPAGGDLCPECGMKLDQENLA